MTFILIAITAVDSVDHLCNCTVLCRVFVDPALDSLAHLHECKKWTAPSGAIGSPAKGSNRPRCVG